jgi:hypothetical protein
VIKDDTKLNPFGFTEAQWSAAKAEAKGILAEHAKRRQMVPYSDFVRKLHSIRLEHHDPRLFHFLGEISVEENEAGRGMLTALVVHKHGGMQPGPGFFELAKKLGHKTSDIEKFWIDEVKKVFAAWQD